MSALFTQCPGDTVQTGTGKVDPARKFKCTTVARDLMLALPENELFMGNGSFYTTSTHICCALFYSKPVDRLRITAVFGYHRFLGIYNELLMTNNKE